MDSPVPPMPDASPAANRDRALGIIATATVLAAVKVNALTGGWASASPACRPGADTVRGADKSATSLGHAVQICLDMHPEATQP